MSGRQYQRAERCFALARSTTFAGEREAAIARGKLIADKAGLSLDMFDIPGRQRAPQPASSSPPFEGNGFFGDNFRYVRGFWGERSTDDILRSIQEELLRQANRQASEVQAEHRRRQQQRRVDPAVDFLRARGCVVKRYADGSYTVGEHHSPDARVSGETIIMAAKSRGWKG